MVNLFFQNCECKPGILWKPKKALFPETQDVSVGGHVQNKEDYDEVFQEETYEASS